MPASDVLLHMGHLWHSPNLPKPPIASAPFWLSDSNMVLCVTEIGDSRSCWLPKPNFPWPLDKLKALNSVFVTDPELLERSAAHGLVAP